MVSNADYQHLYWAGSSFEFTMLDPLTFAADVMWGMSDTSGSDALDRSGWFFDFKVAYKTPYVTPALLAWYGTGDDDNMYNGSERMPTIAGHGTLTGSTFGMDGSSVLNACDYVGQDNEFMGTWGVGLEFGDISFIEDLTHTVRVVFMGGTNDPYSMRDYRSAGDGYNYTLVYNSSEIMMTTADWAWEVDFDHKYQIYENLAAIVETGMIDMHRDKSAWKTGAVDDGSKLWKTGTAWKLAVGLKYTF